MTELESKVFPRVMAIELLGQQYGSEVIALASIHLQKMMEGPENPLLHDMTKQDHLIFMMAFMERLMVTYNKQIKIIRDNHCRI